jgi:hypothetical protein
MNPRCLVILLFSVHCGQIFRVEGDIRGDIIAVLGDINGDNRRDILGDNMGDISLHKSLKTGPVST